MLQFDKNNVEKFKIWLYNSCIHDAALKCIEYDKSERILIVNAENLVFDVKFNFVFNDVEGIFLINKNKLADSENILSLTIEDIKMPKMFFNSISYKKNIDENLCLLFQMFSGTEIYVFFNNVVLNMLNTKQ